jgi:hypothetical protein
MSHTKLSPELVAANAKYRAKKALAGDDSNRQQHDLEHVHAPRGPPGDFDVSGTKLRVLDDYLDLIPFAREVDRHPRTVRRWLDQPDGLPFSRIGNRILIHVPTAREWIFGRMCRPNARRSATAARQSTP